MHIVTCYFEAKQNTHYDSVIDIDRLLDQIAHYF